MKNIPIEWEEGTLNDLCSLKKDSCQPSESKANIYIGLEHIESGRFSLCFYGKPEQVVSAKNCFAPNDILYGKLRPYLDKAAVAITEGICSTDILVFTPKDKTPPFFIAGLLHTDRFIQYAIQTTHGLNHPRTSWAALKVFPTLIPPLPEQQKIAAILFKIQQAIEIQESIIEKTRELKKSTMHHVFKYGLHGEKIKETEIGQMPESWNIVPILKVYDFTKKPKERIYSDYSYLPFIAMDLIPIDSPHLSKFKLKKTTEISSGTYIEDGDILLAKITPCFENGKQCIVTGLPVGFGIASTEVIPIKEKSGVSDKYFLYFYLLKDDVRRMIAGKMEGATGRQRVPVHLIRDLLIPFPSLSEQNKIAKLFLTIDKKIEIHTAKKLTMQDLFKTMLNKLMTGEIRVKDLDIDVSEVSA